MKMAAYDWDEGGGSIKVTLKRGVKLKNKKVKYRDGWGEWVKDTWRFCPHGKSHPEDRPYFDELSTNDLREMKKSLCHKGCFQINIKII